jgi:hypothetical protein
MAGTATGVRIASPRTVGCSSMTEKVSTISPAKGKSRWMTVTGRPARPAVGVMSSVPARIVSASSSPANTTTPPTACHACVESGPMTLRPKTSSATKVIATTVEHISATADERWTPPSA